MGFPYIESQNKDDLVIPTLYDTQKGIPYFVPCDKVGLSEIPI